MSRKKERDKRTERDKRKQRQGTLPGRLARVIAEATRHIDAGELDEALDLLEPLESTHPTHPAVLLTRIALAGMMRNDLQVLDLAERYAKVLPNDPAAHGLLAGAYVQNGFPSLALREYRSFLARWPDELKAPFARTTIAQLEPGVVEAQANLGLTGETGFACACLNEGVRKCLHVGQMTELKQLAEQLLKLQPGFLPVLNNLTEAYYLEWDLARALETARRVLAIQADNVFASANLVRIQLLSGHVAEALAAAEGLKRLRPRKLDEWAKIEEGLSIVGDDEGVLQAFQGAMGLAKDGSPLSLAVGEHLAAVAHYRLGRLAEARILWRQAAKRAPGFPYSRGNLEGLDQPRGQQNAGWAFPTSEWLPKAPVAELIDRITAAPNPQAQTAIAQLFLNEHPEVRVMIPVLLDRGDPFGRELAFRLAEKANTPETLAALRDFALSNRGPDPLRGRAAEIAVGAGLIPSGLVRLWLDGKWQEVLVLGFAVTTESKGTLSKRGAELAKEASNLLNRGKGAEAELLLREALKTDPEAPSIHYNVSTALRQQGRIAEADALLREIHRRFPDYFFGIVGVADLATAAGRLDEAKQLLERVIHQKKFHVSEIGILTIAQINILLAQNDRRNAARWLQMLEGLNPQDPNLPILRDLVNARESW